MSGAVRNFLHETIHGWPLLSWPLLRPYRYRPPRPQEARRSAATSGFLAVIVFCYLCYPELRKNLVWLEAECQSYEDPAVALVPEIKPYRHCYRSCGGCFPSHSPVPCISKMGVHYSVNIYDMSAMRVIAGACAGGPCCAREVCDTCQRTETRCRRHLSSSSPLWPAWGSALPVDAAELVADLGELGPNQTVVYQGEPWEEMITMTEPETDDAAGDPSARAEPAMSGGGPRRRLQGAGGGGSSSCSRVTVNYDCNCRCVQRVAAQACHVHCLPYWRSFIPLAITLPYPERGFYPYKHTQQSVATAVQGLSDLMKVNATTAAYEKLKKDPVDLGDLETYVDAAEAFHPKIFDAPPPIEPQPPETYRRIATIVYEHRASRARAVAKLMEPHFAPGVVSQVRLAVGRHAIPAARRASVALASR